MPKSVRISRINRFDRNFVHFICIKTTLIFNFNDSKLNILQFGHHTKAEIFSLENILWEFLYFIFSVSFVLFRVIIYLLYVHMFVYLLNSKFFMYVYTKRYLWYERDQWFLRKRQVELVKEILFTYKASSLFKKNNLEIWFNKCAFTSSRLIYLQTYTWVSIHTCIYKAYWRIIYLIVQISDVQICLYLALICHDTRRIFSLHFYTK